MNKQTYRALTLAACMAIAGQSATAQSTAANNSKLQHLQTQDPATYVADDNAYELPWTKIPESNIPWKKKVWRDIDGTQAGNTAFAKSSDGSKTLAGILLQGAIGGTIKAYSAENDRFTKELSKGELLALITPGKSNTGYDLARVTNYRIKEDWLYLEKEAKVVVRILGIAPMVKVTAADGKVTEQPLCWVYYPDARNYLAEQKVARIQDMNWDKLLQARSFASSIVTAGEPITHANVPVRK